MQQLLRIVKIRKYFTLVGLIRSKDLSKCVPKMLLHDDLHGLISVSSGQPSTQSSN